MKRQKTSRMLQVMALALCWPSQPRRASYEATRPLSLAVAAAPEVVRPVPHNRQTLYGHFCPSCFNRAKEFPWLRATGLILPLSWCLGFHP